MKRRLRTVVYWPGIDKDIEKFCKSCYGCQLVSQPSKPEPMVRTDLPSGPWEHLSADLLGPLPDGNYVFVLVDLYSRFFEIAILKNTSAEKITQVMWKMFVTHGLPLLIQTDNGSQFLSQHFSNFMAEFGIYHRRVSPYWSPAQGQVERENRSILKRIKIAQTEKRDWKSELDHYLLMYRSTPHSITGVSPAEALYRRKMRTKLPLLLDHTSYDQEMRDRDSEQKEKGKVYGDKRRNACESELKPGDKVLMKQNMENKFQSQFKPQFYKVLHKTGNSVLVESDQGVKYRRNVTHLKKFHERTSDKPVSRENLNMPRSEPDLPIEIPREPDTNPHSLLSSPALNSRKSVNEPEMEKDSSLISTPVKRYNLRSERERRVPEKFKDYVME
ncbi:MAG: DDE-type integrase/transposase/recombinase [Candidatus Thiodiazotropha endolucinida]|nr:DDE-type integrase/transposase/recombinase [Candidatus Thiodiazotropha endolucinida]